MAEALSGMTGALQGSVTGMLNKGQGFFDRFFPPEKRAQLSQKISKFATEKPMLAVSLQPFADFPLRSPIHIPPNLFKQR